MKRRTWLLISAASAVCACLWAQGATPDGEEPAPAERVARGVVFEDVNANGRRDRHPDRRR